MRGNFYWHTRELHIPTCIICNDEQCVTMTLITSTCQQPLMFTPFLTIKLKIYFWFNVYTDNTWYVIKSVVIVPFSHLAHFDLWGENHIFDNKISDLKAEGSYEYNSTRTKGIAIVGSNSQSYHSAKTSMWIQLVAGHFCLLNPAACFHMELLNITRVSVVGCVVRR